MPANRQSSKENEMSELLNSTTLKNDTRLDEFLADTKKLADSESKSSDSLLKTALRLVRETASGVVDNVDTVKQLWNINHDTIEKRNAANHHRKARKPMTKRGREQQQAKLVPYFKVGQVKSVTVESVEDDKAVSHDYSGEAAMDHVTRLYKTMTEANSAYTAYGACAVLLKDAAEANQSVTDAELIHAMTNKDKAAKKSKNSKQWLEQACKIIGDVMNGTKKGVEQDNAKEVQDSFAILSGYLARLTLKAEHDALVIRAAKVGYDVARLESNPRPLAGRKRSQRRG
jgi:hypothetical protein